MKLRWEHHGACWLLRHENGWTEALAAKDNLRHHGWVALTTSAGSHAVEEISRSSLVELKAAVIEFIASEEQRHEELMKDKPWRRSKTE